MKPIRGSHLFVCLSIASTSVSCASSETATTEQLPPVQDAASDARPDTTTHDVAAEPPPEAGPDVVEAASETAVPDAPPEAAPPADAHQEADASGWPTCDSKPAGVQEQTLPQIWQQDATTPIGQPSSVWVSGVLVTAVSEGGCSAGRACHIYLQDAETYASFADGAHHAMQLSVSGAVAVHFTSIKVRDKVDVFAHALRDTASNPPQNELLLRVSYNLPGCAKKLVVSPDPTPTPITGVQLTDLTVAALEQTHGPLLIRVDAVTGKPGPANEVFAIRKTGGGFNDAGLESVVNVSPYFLSGASFSGLPTDGATAVSFDSITGVFGVYVPQTDGGTGGKYLMIYPRTISDLVKTP
jgi:hypothetical protein